MQSPLVSFQSPAAFKAALTTMGAVNEALFNSLANRGLPPITSAGAFGALLGINPKLLTAMAKFPDRYYRKFTIPRKSGGEREILAPRTFLKTVQHYIATEILGLHQFGNHVTGFVKHRGINENGAFHRGAPFLLNVDLADFFGSVRERNVRQAFEDLGYSRDVARLLMGLCTYRDSLPQGAPTSPGLSNLAFEAADQDIITLSSSHGLTYSRYADDLTFSSQNAPISRSFLRSLGAIISLHGFQLNARKTRFAKPGQAKYVTGMVVNEKVHPKRELRRRLRAMFHQARLRPEKFSDQASIIKGWASFVNSYDRRLGPTYLKIAASLQHKR